MRPLSHPITTVCRHFGYCAHPQNELPASIPFFAVRITIGVLHVGHIGGFCIRLTPTFAPDPLVESGLLLR
jgi:hypothetical protein